MNLLILIARILTIALWFGLLGICFVESHAIIVLIWFTYLIWPGLKHPCDYGSYAAWWADRRNWCDKVTFPS